MDRPDQGICSEEKIEHLLKHEVSITTGNSLAEGMLFRYPGPILYYPSFHQLLLTGEAMADGLPGPSTIMSISAEPISTAASSFTPL